MNSHLASRTFTLDKQFLTRFQFGPEPAWGPIGEVVAMRTFPREKDDGSRESWFEVVQRVVEGTFSIQKNWCAERAVDFSEEKTQRTAQKMFEAMWSFSFLPPGRGLFIMGTEHLVRVGASALNNCAFVSTQDFRDDVAKPFCFMMDMSMLTVGVGFDTRGAGSVTIGEPGATTPYIVEDSRDGWVLSLRALIEAYSQGKSLPRFDYSKIRPAGSRLSGLGGTSSGYAPLEDLHTSVQAVLKTYIDLPLDSIGIVDIMNLIGRCVVAGNVRRTAQIALGDHQDTPFMTLKRDKEALSHHRWASNNSIIAHPGMDYTFPASLAKENCDLGFFWVENAQNYGRLKDGINPIDHRVMGVNPCGEQSLESYELCCLVETFPSRHASLAQYMNTLKLAYIYAKTVSLLDTHWDETSRVIQRNHRIGLSQSGITRSFAVHGMRRTLDWSDQAYTFLKGLDAQYSTWWKVPQSVKMTTVKPSGTVSLLPGEPPGIHPVFSEYYIRRVEFGENDPMLERLEQQGYRMEHIPSKRVYSVCFPVREQCGTPTYANTNMWMQLEHAAQYQYYWSDNQVSCTINVRPEEMDDLPKALSLYETRLKSISVLPVKHDYEGAVYEEITEARYLELHKELKRRPNLGTLQGEGVGVDFCDSDSCLI